MNEAEMQDAWHSSRNELSRDAQQALAAGFLRQMTRRRRFQAVWLINTFFWLTLITILGARSIALGKVRIEHEWALIPMLVIPWFFAFHFLRRFLKTRRGSLTGALPVIDSLRAARMSIQDEQSRLRRVGLLFLILTPVIGLSMRQLHVAGKVSAGELASMAVLFGVVLLLSGAGIAARYFGRLLLQQRKLDDLLADLTQPPK